jgi:hypothetical protein
MTLLKAENPKYESIYNTKVSEDKEESFHPTSIPWLNDLSSCEETGRVWKNDQCWDLEHSAMF